MATSEQDMLAKMDINLKEKTGKGVAEWAEIVKRSGLEKHGEQMQLLKETHGLGHGYANLVCQTAKGRLDANEDDLLADQYKGKADLRPIYEAIVAHVTTFGLDVRIVPKKTSVAIRRAKNFAVVTPATKTRIDLGLNLKGTEPTDRLLAEKPGAMCTHKVRIEHTTEVDAELKAWLRSAYELAG